MSKDVALPGWAVWMIQAAAGVGLNIVLNVSGGPGSTLSMLELQSDRGGGGGPPRRPARPV